MCLILFSYKTHKKYKLILAANRDEFYARPTLAMQWWKNNDNVLSGIDAQMNGTWMGINKNGRFAALTNYRQMPITAKYESTRGALVSDFISNNLSIEDYKKQLVDTADNYDGYNLIFGSIDNLHYFSNRGDTEGEIESGVHGLSNHLMNTPWPKVETGKERLAKLSAQDEIHPNLLFEMMHNTDLGEDSDLPDTGVGLELERMLSAAFIESPEYGTRCSTVLLVDWENNVTFEERSFVPKGENKYNFTIQ